MTLPVLVLLSTVAAAEGDMRTTITDKTLVAWVCLDDLDHRGGAILSLFDEAERFDAIVVGEVSPRRWMAGSDFFHRTEQDQAEYPVENADPNTLVRVAITYRGNRIDIYRDDQHYAGYSVSEPQTFATDVAVLIGLRYLGRMGAIGHFAGRIGEARVYDVALDAEVIRALRPGQPSDPKPIGMWTFEGGSTEDAMGRFPPGKLRGKAKIVDGALVLDGETGYMVSKVEYPENQLMFYRAKHEKTGNMWDTWLFLHEGTYYLYYLANREGRWDNISMATSGDGVHWNEIGPVLTKRPGATWMGTGSTWRSPNFADDGRFLMNFSEWRGERQTIFFAESTDLIHWTRLGDEYEFHQDARWYKETGRWDCIYTIPRPEGGLYGYWTADPMDRPGVGFGRTLDGVTWEALEPPVFEEGAPHGEAGAVEKIAGRYYLMLGSDGMKTLVADAPEGPFRPAERNFRLLYGHTYFTRFFPTPDGVLVNHHSIARSGEVYFAPLKRALVDDEGTLRLGWWEGNEALKKHRCNVEAPESEVDAGPAFLVVDEPLDTDNGLTLEGDVSLPRYAYSARPGLYVGCVGTEGTAMLIGPGGVTEIGQMHEDGTGFEPEQRVDREMDFGQTARFRLLLKHSLFELYLDDVLIQCYSLPGRATGRIGVVGPAGAVSDLESWEVGTSG